MRLDLERLAGTSICAGASAGRELFSRIIPLLLQEPKSPEPLILDFAGVDVATASFLRESIFALKSYVRGRKSNYYPVVANTNEFVLDEIEVILRAIGDVILACTIDARGVIDESRTLGVLEGKAERVFMLVQQRGETDASELQRDFGAAEGVQQTAWNNRLASLAASGLIAEVSVGRSKRYRPLLAGE